MKRKFMAFFMAIVLLIVPYTVTAADVNEDVVSPKWTYVFDIAVALTPNGYIGGTVSLEGFYDFLLTLQLQEDDGSGWSTRETWTTEGNLSGGIEDYCTLYPDCSYRAKVTVEVYNSLGRVVETVSLYSDVV